MAKTVDVLSIPHTYELTASTEDICLVFIHGWLLSREYWRPLIQHLQDYPCLLYDLRGFGDSQDVVTPSEDADVTSTVALPSTASSKDRLAIPAIALSHPAETVAGAEPTAAAIASPYSPVAYAHDLNQLLTALNIQKAWVIGHSLGGSIGLWTAFRYPERICGCICVNSGGGIYLKEEFEKFRAAGQQLVRLRPPWLRRLPLIDFLMARMNVAQPLKRRWGRQRLIDLLAAQSEAALGTLLESTTEEEVHRLPHVVSHLTQPAYFIAGDSDDIMETQYVNHLASFHYLFQGTGQNVIELPRCGHFAMIEQPERLAKEIRVILTQHADTGS